MQNRFPLAWLQKDLFLFLLYVPDMYLNLDICLWIMLWACPQFMGICVQGVTSMSKFELSLEFRCCEKRKQEKKKSGFLGCPGAKKNEFLTSVLDALSTDMVHAVSDPSLSSSRWVSDPFCVSLCVWQWWMNDWGFWEVILLLPLQRVNFQESI